MTVNLYFRWFDLWIGAFYDRQHKTWYVQLTPMLGLKVTLK